MGPDGRWVMAGLTDIGCVRKCNEDAIVWDADIGLAVLADGMGGHNAGEVASALAVQSVKSDLTAALSQPGFRPHGEDARAWHAALVETTVRKVNERLNQAATAQPHYAGMGTTLAMALFADDLVTICHVGDSRVYRLREDRLEPLTVDHSLIQELVQRGYMTEEEARVSEHRSVLTRALGTVPQVNVDVRQHALRSGDLYLLCSDGLTNLVCDRDIRARLRRLIASPEDAVQELIRTAKERGGYDNISVILVLVG